MPPTRSTTDRRRRVLYASHHSDLPATTTPASRRETQRLRQARRPTAKYAHRVQRRLQGRWFSLVPVSRRDFAIMASAITSVSLVLVLLHYLAVTWPALVYATEIARPLRLDQADSFGRWYLSMLLAVSAGVSLLIYQLRRYRIDDYRGQYRLWRTVLITLVIASVGVSVSLVSWVGGSLDLVIGQRVALAGTDWIRLLVSIGGAVLVLRLVAETHRSRFSLASLLVASFALAIPEAAGWNLFATDTPGKWVGITSAPLLGCTALLLSLGAYLRMLYREVCEIEAGPTLREQFAGFPWNVFRRDVDTGDVEKEESPVTVAVAAKPQNTKSVTPEKKKRRFGWRSQSETVTADDVPPPDAESESEPDATTTMSEIDSPKKRFGLGGFFKRKSAEASGDDGETDLKADAEIAPVAKVSPRAMEPTADPSSDESIDFTPTADSDSIDWTSLSKSERRRLRKELKRQNRAA